MKQKEKDNIAKLIAFDWEFAKLHSLSIDNKHYHEAIKKEFIEDQLYQIGIDLDTDDELLEELEELTWEFISE